MRFRAKAFTSLFLAVTFVALSLSAIVLYVAPRCRVAEQMGWTVAGLEKDQWESIHINGGLFFILAGVLHLVLNWPVFWSYIKNRQHAALNLRLELLASVVLGGLVLVGSALAWPPFRSVVELHDHIKDSWGRPPRPTALSQPADPTVQDLSEQMHLAADQVIGALEAEGIAVPDSNATLGRIAEANQLTPEEVREAIARRFPEADRPAEQEGSGLGGGAGRGLGGGGGRGLGGGGGGGRGGGGG
ncbi:MAG: DUF4405 domain-containing protein, partial [Thermoguttaceae bacterium]|nr:DUF4405 domain-containing protein [Thermoguttaceae bacterium]